MCAGLTLSTAWANYDTLECSGTSPALELRGGPATTSYTIDARRPSADVQVREIAVAP